MSRADHAWLLVVLAALALLRVAVEIVCFVLRHPVIAAAALVMLALMLH